MLSPDQLHSAVLAAAGSPRAAVPTAGDVDPRGRVAWIESPADDIAILFVAAGGQITYQRALNRHDASNWGYEGCSGRLVAWHGERIVVVTQESSRSYLWSIDPDRRFDEALCMQRAWVIDGDLVVWVDNDPGLLSTAALPSLDPRPPLPYRIAPEHPHYRLENRRSGHLDITTNIDGGRFVETLALPTAAQRTAATLSTDFSACVAQLLFPGVRDAAVPTPARLLIEAVTEPFVRTAPWRLPAWHPAPVWIAVYWHRHLLSIGDTAAANELLAVLDAIAAPLPESAPEPGWNPKWSAHHGPVELACRHVRRQAGVQAAACRSGVLPPGCYCMLFLPAPGSETPGSRVDPDRLPALVRRIFLELAPTCPKTIQSESAT